MANSSLTFRHDNTKYINIKRGTANEESYKFTILAGEQFIYKIQANTKLGILFRNYNNAKAYNFSKDDEDVVAVYGPNNFGKSPYQEICQVAKKIENNGGNSLIVIGHNKHEQKKLLKAYERESKRLEITIPVIILDTSSDQSLIIKESVKAGRMKEKTTVILGITDKKTSSNEPVSDSVITRAWNWTKRQVVGLNFGLAKKLKKDCIDNVQLGWVDSADNTRYEVAHGILRSYYQQYTENYELHDEVEQELDTAFKVLTNWRSSHARNQDILYLYTLLHNDA